MNQPVPPASDDTAPVGARLLEDEDVAAAVRLPGPLGRRREDLPVAPAAPPVPSALSAFNRLTGRLDQGPVTRSGRGEATVVTEISGAPVAPVRATVRDRRA
jgi:hypothetical protein